MPLPVTKDQYMYSLIYILINNICYIQLTSEYQQMNYICDIFGYHIWLQSDAAFYYPRLDKYSLSVGMFCATCDLTRRPLGRLATRRAGPRGFSLRQEFDGTRPIADIYERYH